MLYRFSLVAYGSLLLSTASSVPYESIDGPNSSVVARSMLSKRAEPNTGVDLPDLPNHPNQLDPVETAFNDAFELASYVVSNIDTDTTIFPKYFDNSDKAGVKNVFVAILGITGPPEGPIVGNQLLGNIDVQTTDVEGLCSDGNTLAYMADQSTEKPIIVLCPNAFKKKAVTILKGAAASDTNWYITCDDLVNNGHVSYLMNSLGATLLHEYTCVARIPWRCKNIRLTHPIQTL